MTREQFKDLAMEIIAQQKFGELGVLFSSDNMDNFKVAQYDDDEWDVEAAFPLEDFLDELWKIVFNDDYNAEMKKWWDKRIVEDKE